MTGPCSPINGKPEQEQHADHPMACQADWSQVIKESPSHMTRFWEDLEM